jgi:hypothetical protein
MKNIILLLVLLLNLTNKGQNNLGKSNDLARISLASYVPPQTNNLPPAALNLINDKLNQIVTKSGMGGSSKNERFIIVPNITVATKEVTETAPPVTVLVLDVTFHIGDGIEGKKFSSSKTITLRGGGADETKAYVAAIRSINPSNPDIQAFVEEGKSKIIEYYNSKCDFLLKDAEALSNTKKYDEAIFKLASVPEVCKECYEKCSDKISDVFKVKMENECQTFIAKAKVFIAQENYFDAAEVLSPVLPELKCYPEAQVLIKDINDHKCATAMGQAKGAWASHDVNSTSAALSSIPSDSKCYQEAMALVDEVKKYVKETEKRDFEFNVQKQRDEKDVKMANIKAARDVGVAYGNNQPKEIVTYKVYGW